MKAPGVVIHTIRRTEYDQDEQSPTCGTAHAVDDSLGIDCKKQPGWNLTGNHGGMNQLSLANGYERSTNRTRRQAFLEEMLAIVPSDALVARIAPYAPAGTTGRPPYPVLVLLRVHFLQQWFALADEAAEEALHDIPVYRAFAGIDPSTTGITDATTIPRFRHLLREGHGEAVALP